MNVLHTWAQAWGVPAAALYDLQTRLGLLTPAMNEEAGPSTGKSEAWAQSAVRLEASQKGARLFRNNVGALKDQKGRLVRYGLANDSAQMNAAIKSGDLVGIRPVLIGPHHIGQKVGVFVSREIKEPGWQYSGTEREVAQLAWVNLITSMGGDAAFATGPGTL